MKHLIVLAALLLCSNAQAATYVYQAKAYQGHSGRCGKALLPFQMTITVRKAFPPNRNLNVPLETVSIDAGGKFQWTATNTKQHQLGGIFVTDGNGDITGWSVAGATRRSQAWTHNEPNSVEDFVEFKCGSAGNGNDPGIWTRTE